MSERDPKTPPPPMKRLPSVSDGRPRTSDDRDRYVPKTIVKREGTPVHGTPIEQFESRVKRTLRASEASLDTIGEVRREFREDLGKMHERLEGVVGDVGDMREQLGRVDGKLDVITQAVQAQQTATLQHQTVTMTAQVEIDKTQKIASIEETHEVRKFRRELFLKLIASGAFGGLITWLGTRC